MALTQVEADSLLQMPKEFVDPEPLEFTQCEPMNYDRLLHSMDRREQFILTIERGQRNRIRLKYQTRARKIIVKKQPVAVGTAVSRRRRVGPGNFTPSLSQNRA